MNESQQSLTDYVADILARNPGNDSADSVLSELEVLQSIYGDSLKTWHPTEPTSHSSESEGTIRYQVTLNLDPYEDVEITILVSLLHTYPATPPQLQLLSRYIGNYAADANLFGNILRTFISVTGVEWTPNSVCVFDGLQSILDVCRAWYEERLGTEEPRELLREEDESRLEIPHKFTEIKDLSVPMPDGIEIIEAEPIVDRKSSFVGRACRISHPSQVPLILTHLLTDRRISRAAHPIINAWRCQVGQVLHQDNDDDGETAAGGRLAHLIQILDVSNVLVIVSRYWGGIHLGPDRFKHINTAARNALELGGFLDSPTSKRPLGRGKKR